MNVDAVFSSLHTDVRWQRVVELLNTSQFKHFTNSRLRVELLARSEIDQAARRRFAVDLSNLITQQELVAVDVANTARLQQEIAKYG